MSQDFDYVEVMAERYFTDAKMNVNVNTCLHERNRGGGAGVMVLERITQTNIVIWYLRQVCMLLCYCFI